MDSCQLVFEGEPFALRNYLHHFDLKKKFIFKPLAVKSTEFELAFPLCLGLERWGREGSGHRTLWPNVL